MEADDDWLWQDLIVAHAFQETLSGPDGPARLVADRACGLKGARGRFEVGAPPPSVWLEMVALRPFVPRVHEQDALLRLTLDAPRCRSSSPRPLGS